MSRAGDPSAEAGEGVEDFVGGAGRGLGPDTARQVRSKLFDKAPKTAAGVRPIAFPAEVLPALVEHLGTFTKKPKDAHLFEGPRGGLLRRSNFADTRADARKDAGISADVHFHDLRHTGNTLASSTGASTRELMTRMGHSSTRAALIH